MRRRGPLALWIALYSSSLFAAADSFTIRSAGAAGHIEVRYFLSGPFGGYGSFVREPDKDGAYRIPLEQDGKPARSLKLILYAKGCKFAILSVDLLSNPTRSATFECSQLSTVSLRGRVWPPPGDISREIEVLYVASWDHKFFGIADGAVSTFKVGNAPVDVDGGFQIGIPDFSNDSVTTLMNDACLYFRMIERSTGNSVGRISPLPDLQRDGVGLRILPVYDSEIDLREQR